MNPYIITLIGIGLLAPIIYFVPSNLTAKGKGVLLLASLIIAETGVLALDIFSYWKAAGLLLLLLVLTSYLLHNRARTIFIDLTEMESGAAKEKSDEPEQFDHEKGSFSDDDSAKNVNGLDEGPSEVDQFGHMMVESLEKEYRTESFGPDILLNEVNEHDEAYTLPRENMDLVMDNIIGNNEQDTISGESLEHIEPITISGESLELDDLYMSPIDNSDYILDGPMEAEVIGDMDVAQKKESRVTLEEPGLMSKLHNEESETSTEGNDELEGEESYLASIEKMLEEGEMEEINPPLDSRPQPNISIDSKQDVLTEEWADADKCPEGEDDSDQDANLVQVHEETDSVIQTDMDSEDKVLEELEDLPSIEEDSDIGANFEEDKISSEMEGIPYSSQQQELDHLIIDTLKFAKFDLELDRYISLLEKQLEKELPVQMHYEIALMLIDAFYKAGQYNKSIDLIEKMKSDFGHLPAVFIELETLFMNVKKLMH